MLTFDQAVAKYYRARALFVLACGNDGNTETLRLAGLEMDAAVRDVALAAVEEVLDRAHWRAAILRHLGPEKADG